MTGSEKIHKDETDDKVQYLLEGKKREEKKSAGTALDYGLVGSFFEENFELIKKISERNEPVLITGPSGVGKNILAKVIHLLSPRNNENFDAVNFSEITDSLFASEIFGHKKGAFTGAYRDRDGIIMALTGGTILFDEIGDTPINLQPKILRLVQDKEIRPIGSNIIKKVDIRIIAATNQDLEKLVGEKKFREDLFYRLNVLRIHIPPLKDRKDEIYDLILHFMLEYLDNNSNIVKPSGKELNYVFQELYKLPLKGNVRELQMYITRWLIFQGIKTIDQIIEEVNGFQQLKPPEEKKVVEADFEEKLEIKPSEHSKDPNFMEVKVKNFKEQRENLYRLMIKKAIKEGDKPKDIAKKIGVTPHFIYERIRKYKKEEEKEEE